MLGAVYRYTTGQAWGRRVVVTGLPQGSQPIRVEPQGTRRAAAINTLALRVEKTMTVPRVQGTVGVFADLFNLWNHGVLDSDRTDAINFMSGSRFGEPTVWIDPRMLRVGVRVTY